MNNTPNNSATTKTSENKKEQVNVKKKLPINIILAGLIVISAIGNIYLFQLNNKTNTSLADLSVQNLALQENVKSLETANATLEADYTALKEEVAELAEKVNSHEGVGPAEIPDTSEPAEEYVPDYSSPEAKAANDEVEALPDLERGNGVTTNDDRHFDWE